MPVNNTRIAQRLATLAAKPATNGEDAARTDRANERAEPREQVYRFGRLLYGQNVEMKCIVADISEGGARVKFDVTSEGLPEYVVLKFEATGQTRRARVVWQRDHSAGLSFRLQRQGKFTGFAARP
jgi:hypothetical protein